MVASIVDALDTAHRQGVIHRDLKPQNVMVTPAGTPKLLDFGIAKVRQTPEQARGTTTTHLESAEGAAGTPGYMAPEVLQGQRADARSDLFSLGVVFYECLTGVQPFSGMTPQEVWGKVCMWSRRCRRTWPRTPTPGSTSCAAGCSPRTRAIGSSRRPKCVARCSCCSRALPMAQIHRRRSRGGKRRRPSRPPW